MSYVTVTIDVDDVMEQVDDDDLVEEMRSRGLAAGGFVTQDDATERLEKIYHLMRMCKADDAYLLMCDYVRDTLGRAV
jgi:hypothetical protein